MAANSKAGVVQPASGVLPPNKTAISNTGATKRVKAGGGGGGGRINQAAAEVDRRRTSIRDLEDSRLVDNEMLSPTEEEVDEDLPKMTTMIAESRT